MDQAKLQMYTQQVATTDIVDAPGHSSGAPRELVLVSDMIGNDLSLVQGGGGNTSLKQDNDFWIKASGTWLAESAARDIFVRLPLAQVRELMAYPDIEPAIAALAPPGGLRPSIETSLHALLPHRAVLHVHSVNAIAWASRIDAQDALSKALNGLSWAWVPYRRPGAPLTEALREVLSALDAAPDILILGNHGLVIGGDSCHAAETRLHEVEARLALPARAPGPVDPHRLQALNDSGWEVCTDTMLNAIATDAITCGIATRGALYPDHVVFLGERALIVDEARPLSRTLYDAGLRPDMPPPLYAIVPGAGLLLAPAITAGAKAMLHCLAEVGLRVAAPRNLRFLDHDDAAQLLGWEAEAYRRARDRPSSTDSR